MSIIFIIYIFIRGHILHNYSFIQGKGAILYIISPMDGARVANSTS